MIITDTVKVSTEVIQAGLFVSEPDSERVLAGFWQLEHLLACLVCCPDAPPSSCRDPMDSVAVLGLVPDRGVASGCQ